MYPVALSQSEIFDGLSDENCTINIWYWHTVFAIAFPTKILLLCRSSFWTWKPVLKRLSSVGSKAMPRERTLFVEEENHLLGTSALYHSAHHTLQKVKVSKLKCQTKSVKWECESVNLYLLRRKTTCWALLHFITQIVHTAHHTLQKCETLYADDANNLLDPTAHFSLTT